MSDYLVTDTELTSVANAIRTKGGTSADLSFPTEFVSAINAIQTGITPTGVKYVYSDIDEEGAWDVSGYAKLSYDFAPVNDGVLRVWVDANATNGYDVTLVFGTTPTIDWGDGNTSIGSNVSHTYSTDGRYCVEVSGEIIPNNYTFGQTYSVANTNVIAVEFLQNQATGFTQSYLMRNCTALKKATVEGGYSQTATSMFQDCTNLKSVKLLGQPLTIKPSTFWGCSNLETVILPSSVKTLEGSCFRNSGIESIIIPANVNNIGYMAFNGCVNLEEVHLLSATPPSLNSNVFGGCSANLTIYVPSASLSAYQSATNWSTYASQIVGE